MPFLPPCFVLFRFGQGFPESVGVQGRLGWKPGPVEVRIQLAIPIVDDAPETLAFGLQWASRQAPGPAEWEKADRPAVSESLHPLTAAGVHGGEIIA
jgi:hypothetical protein